MLDLLKNGVLVRQVVPGSRLAIPEAEIVVMPAQADWEFGEYSLVESPPPPEPDPPTPEEVLASLSDVSHAQMIAALISEGIITRAEGRAWISGTLPSVVEDIISLLPASQQDIAYLRAIRPSSVVPTDPLVAALAVSQGKTTEDLIDLFEAAASL